MQEIHRGNFVKVMKPTSALYEWIGWVVSFEGDTLCLEIPLLGTQQIDNITREEIEYPLKHPIPHSRRKP